MPLPYQQIEAKIVLPFIMKTLPKELWTHEAHIFTAIWHLLAMTFDEALCLMRSRIICYNVASGGENTASSGYHETLTQFYLKTIEQYLKNETALNFDEICNNIINTVMAERNYPFKFYSKELLFSTKCRAIFVEPDLIQLEC